MTLRFINSLFYSIQRKFSKNGVSHSNGYASSINWIENTNDTGTDNGVIKTDRSHLRNRLTTGI